MLVHFLFNSIAVVYFLSEGLWKVLALELVRLYRGVGLFSLAACELLAWRRLPSLRCFFPTSISASPLEFFPSVPVSKLLEELFRSWG